MKNEFAKDIVNAGIGSYQTLGEFYQNTVNELGSWKDTPADSFNAFKEKGEQNINAPYLDIKVNVAWALVYLKDAKEKLNAYFSKNNS
ncbi:MAG: hypothetical protein AAF518_00855 [Spirochaetota bacterium]